MQILGTTQEAKEKVLRDAKLCMERIRNIAGTSFDTARDGVLALQRIRSEAYEDLNQIQHEHLIVCAAEWLISQNVCAPDTQWRWNPRQTGDHSEPDLVGFSNGNVLVSAEITTSAKPDGVIDSRMRKTLAKLSQQAGKLFYFVQTEPMATRAATKIRKAGWNIQVAKL